MKLLFFSISIVLIVSACNMNSCINKSYFISTFDRFIEDTQEKNKQYSEKDWESKDAKIKHFVDDCYASFSEDMTGKEKTNFWTKYVQYMITRYGIKTMKEIDKADDASVVEIYEEISEYMEDMDLEKLLKDVYGDDLEEAVDDVLKEINKWGDQLKDWLESKN